MPDPVLYLTAMCSAASVSALVVLALCWLFRAANSTQVNLVSVAGFGLGLAAGYYVLQLQVEWPPANAIGRLLLIVFPVVVGIELIAGVHRVPGWLAWCLRLSLAAVTGRILLHGSVYLAGPRSEWTESQAAVVLLFSALLLAAEWGLLSWLSRQSPGPRIALSIALAIQSAGLAVMLAGYVSGGAACIPFSAAIIGATLASNWFVTRFDSQAVIGSGVVGLFGFLFIGRFFGALSTVAALTIMLAPLCCWALEVPVLRRQNRWLVGALCLVLVAIPLLVVLVLAKQHFDLHTAPLLGQGA